MSHCSKCLFKPPCQTREEMTARHGTPSVFARAVRGAIGEISIDEAEAAVRRYYDDWGAAPHAPTPPQAPREEKRK